MISYRWHEFLTVMVQKFLIVLFWVSCYGANFCRRPIGAHNIIHACLCVWRGLCLLCILSNISRVSATNMNAISVRCVFGRHRKNLYWIDYCVSCLWRVFTTMHSFNTRNTFTALYIESQFCCNWPFEANYLCMEPYVPLLSSTRRFVQLNPAKHYHGLGLLGERKSKAIYGTLSIQCSR